jgi:hypothetical protein
MRRHLQTSVTFLFLILSGLLSCTKIQSYPDTPSIHFKELKFVPNQENESYAKKVELSFSFTDGDGNIGSNDTTVKNLFISFEHKQNGKYYPVSDSLDYNYRIPYLEKTGQNKVMKGSLTVDIGFLPKFINQYDSIRFIFYIYDRNNNKSNTDTSTLIGLK